MNRMRKVITSNRPAGNYQLSQQLKNAAVAKKPMMSNASTQTDMMSMQHYPKRNMVSSSTQYEAPEKSVKAVQRNIVPVRSVSSSGKNNSNLVLKRNSSTQNGTSQSGDHEPSLQRGSPALVLQGRRTSHAQASSR